MTESKAFRSGNRNLSENELRFGVDEIRKSFEHYIGW